MKPFDEKAALRALLTDCRKAAIGPVLFRLHDGEEWVIDEPTDNGEEVVLAANSTGEDTLAVYTPAGQRLGSFYLVWGNAPDGEELVCDYGVNEFTERATVLFSDRYI